MRGSWLEMLPLDWLSLRWRQLLHQPVVLKHLHRAGLRKFDSDLLFALFVWNTKTLLEFWSTQLEHDFIDGTNLAMLRLSRAHYWCHCFERTFMTFLENKLWIFFNLYYLTSDFCYKNYTSRDRKNNRSLADLLCRTTFLLTKTSYQVAWHIVPTMEKVFFAVNTHI